MKTSIIVIAASIALTACAPLSGKHRDGTMLSGTSTPVTVDYAGRACVNQNMYVKMQPCIFPRERR
ncbi:hypothetical protein WS67_06355 [Burkholderia singularis]|uniref:Lipoprotein n=1 Tax=Burkholderia singularis TaxID=1503053 RepID=A0A103E5E1_9BURK|nr:MULTISPECIES: hypothetical protein [Burkholderia]AOK31779.1 hypothetical protein AQ611_19870 [Burkholderia sp. Bp7605]KVE28381.1 hypothetical protein WS67_06355 [Burkholderia singularis]SMG00124.1 hypothetical protein BSIN_0249 [Burkholderia singularis]